MSLFGSSTATPSPSLLITRPEAHSPPMFVRTSMPSSLAQSIAWPTVSHIVDTNISSGPGDV